MLVIGREMADAEAEIFGADTPLNLGEGGAVLLLRRRAAKISFKRRSRKREPRPNARSGK